MAKLLGLITEAMPILHENKFFVPQICGTHLLALSPFKESLTDFFLELYDLLTQRGPCYVALSCCPAEASGPGNGSKIAQLAYLHSLSLYLVIGI